MVTKENRRLGAGMFGIFMKSNAGPRQMFAPSCRKWSPVGDGRRGPRGDLDFRSRSAGE